MLTTEQDLLTRGEKYLDAVIVSQQQKGLRASGYSATHTRFEVVRNGTLITLSLIGPAYWRQQQYGRRGSSRKVRPSTQFVQTIRDWIQVKGIPIPLTAAGAVAYKIVNEGIPVPNKHNAGGVLSEPLNPQRISAEIKASLLPILKQRIVARLLAP